MRSRTARHSFTQSVATRTLSTRERECLLWAARGKTYSETGLILGVAFGTVKQHLDTARLKLNAMNLVQGVAIAVARGVFDADELHITETPLEPTPAVGFGELDGGSRSSHRDPPSPPPWGF